eukprot:999688-Prymnesium_polylepis.1
MPRLCARSRCFGVKPLKTRNATLYALHLGDAVACPARTLWPHGPCSQHTPQEVGCVTRRRRGWDAKCRFYVR